MILFLDWSAGAAIPKAKAKAKAKVKAKAKASAQGSGVTEAGQKTVEEMKAEMSHDLNFMAKFNPVMLHHPKSLCGTQLIFLIEVVF